MERNIPSLRELSRNVCDLIFGLCVLETNETWLQFRLLLLRAGFFALGIWLGACRATQVLNWVEGMLLAARIDNGIPDHSLRLRWVDRCLVGGRIDSRDPHEKLLRIPIKEGCEIWRAISSPVILR